MIGNCILILVGLCAVLYGADWLTKGAVALAERMHISQMVIGMTVVAMGTSMPEFCVSLVSSLKGSPDMAVGNIVGSNIFNTLFIVGAAVLVMPMSIPRITVRRDLPVGVAASVALTLMCLDNRISRLDSALLTAGFIVFMFFTLRTARQSSGSEEAKKAMPLAKSVAVLVIGLLGLIIGANIFVENASALARQLGISDAVIGLTIVAMGTSLPELATSVVAARKGNSGIALGNVLGSNVFNILMILGLTGLICPMSIKGITLIDLGVLTGGSVLLWLFAYTGHKLSRWEGTILVVAFAAYMGWLLH